MSSFQIKMPKIAKRVSTPGTYDLGTSGKSKAPAKSPLRKTGRGRGRPSIGKRVKKPRTPVRERVGYTEQDMLEAIRLVREDEFSINAASKFINGAKLNPVPRMTLSDRLKTQTPTAQPLLGRPQELPKKVEESIVSCLETCANFNFPMGKKRLQDIVQSFVVEHNVVTRWKNERPAKDWVRGFRKRWAHRLKLRRPTSIKRSRAKVTVPRYF